MIDPDEIRERAIGSMYEPEFRALADEIERLRALTGTVAKLPASKHSAKECKAAFEWLRAEATKDVASAHAGVALDEWAATSALLANNTTKQE